MPLRGIPALDDQLLRCAAVNINEIFQNAGFLFVGFFALIMLMLGTLLIGVGLFSIQRHRAAAGWPQAPAVIEVSEVAAERHFENNLMYRPVIRYRYSAPGGTYAGDKMATTGKLYTKEEEARRALARYPLGGTVMARYNPSDPSESVLERVVSGGILLFVFGLLCWILPVIAGIAAGISPQLIAAALFGLAMIPTVLMLQSRSSLAHARSRGLCPPAGSCSDADVMALKARGERLLAIRLYRELHGCGLKEARQAVDNFTSPFQ